MTEQEAVAPKSEAESRDLVERLRCGIVRCDGSMGYVLTRHGVSRNQSFDFLNIENPDAVARVHRLYQQDADVDIIQTNTFGANRLHLATFGRGHEKFVDVINREGVEIARQVTTGTSCLVGGSIGPLTHSTGDALSAALRDKERIRATYVEQISALGRAGVDAFVIETVHRHIEGIQALEVARELFPEIPTVFQVASTRRGETVAGDDLETLIRAAEEAGAACLRLNCFLDPAEMYEKILEIQEWTLLPLSAQPNIGKRGQLCQGLFEAERSLHSTVRTFSAKLIEAGVRLIGGCCGITPSHVGLVRDHLSKLDPEHLSRYETRRRERHARARRVVVGDHGKQPGYQPTPLEADLISGEASRRPILVEIDPPRIGEPIERFIEGARLLAAAGIRTITVGDNPGRVPRLERNLFGSLLREAVPGIELVFHISCADQTLVRFATEIETLHRLTRNILVISGDPPSGEYARSSAPYDFRSISAIRALSRRNHGLSLTWQESLGPTGYFIGGALNPRSLEPQMRKFWTKAADAGASFCLTQPVFERDTLERLYEASEAMRERLREERGRDCFFLPGVMAPVSARNARLLRDDFGMPVPRALIEELQELPGRKARRARGREVMREILSLTRETYPFSGLYIVTQFHNYRSTIADLRATAWLPAEPAGSA